MNKNNINIQPIWLNDLFCIFESIEGLSQVILFGSRARGDHKLKSDIDLAIISKNKKTTAEFIAKIEESNILLKVDVVEINKSTNPKLSQNIKNDGIVIWERKL
jgi:uncharacterized protein